MYKSASGIAESFKLFIRYSVSRINAAMQLSTFERDIDSKMFPFKFFSVSVYSAENSCELIALSSSAFLFSSPTKVYIVL